MGRPRNLRPQLRRDSLGSGGPAPVSVRHHFVCVLQLRNRDPRHARGESPVADPRHPLWRRCGAPRTACGRVALVSGRALAWLNVLDGPPAA